MQYLSPVSLFGEALPTPLDKKAIQLGRKRLFADLELNAGQDIELQGKSYGKNDIIHYFEDLLKENALEYHNTIQNDPVLRIFLEDAHIERKDKFKTDPLYEDETFIRWVSPYYFTSFSSLLEESFLEMNEVNLDALLGNPLLMTQQDQEQSWIIATRLVSDSLASLDNFQAENKRQPTPVTTLSSVSDLMGFRYIHMIQLLPQHRFGELRDKYALSMMRTCIYVFNQQTDNRYLAKTCMENAELLAISPDIKKEIKKKLEEMESITLANPAAQTKKAPSVGKLLWLVLVIIFKLATCNAWRSSNSYSSFNASYPTYRATPRFNTYPSSGAAPSSNTVTPIIVHNSHGDTVYVTHKLNRDSLPGKSRPPKNP